MVFGSVTVAGAEKPAVPQANALGGLCTSLGGDFEVSETATSLSYTCTGLEADTTEDNVAKRRDLIFNRCFDVVRPASGFDSASLSQNFSVVDGVLILTRINCTVREAI